MAGSKNGDGSPRKTPRERAKVETTAQAAQKQMDKVVAKGGRLSDLVERLGK